MRYRFAEFCLDTESGQVTGPRGSVALRRQTWRLLAELVQRAPALVDRDTLLDAVWGHDALSPNVLPQTISELRQALGDSAQQPRLIETRPRRGYRLMVEVAIEGAPARAIVEPAVASAASGAAADRVAAPTARRSSRRPWAIAAVALLAACTVGAFGAWALRAPVAGTGVDPGAVRTLPLVLALAPSQAGQQVPDWVPQAGQSLLVLGLQDDPNLVLARGDADDAAALGGDALRWQAWMREALGAEFELRTSWRGAPGGAVALHYTLVRVANGEVIAAAALQARDPGEAAASAVAEVREALRLAPTDNAMAALLPRQASGRDGYFRALAALRLGRLGDAAAALEPVARSEADGLAGLALASVYRRQGRHTEARNLLERMSSGQAAFPPGLQLRLQAEHALLADRRGDAAIALASLSQLFAHDAALALELAGAQLDAGQGEAAGRTLALPILQVRAASDPRWQLLAARRAGLLADHQAQRHHADTALQLARSYGHRGLEVQAALEQARALHAHGDPAAALAVLEPLARAHPTDDGLAHVRLALGALLRAQGQFDAADTVLAAAQSGFERRGDTGAALLAAIERHTLSGDRGDHVAAHAALLEIGPRADALGAPAVLSKLRNAVGAQAVRLGRHEEAAEAFTSAATHARRAGLARQEAGALNNLAVMWAQQRRFGDASDAWTRALAVFVDSGDRMGEALTLGNLAAAAAAQGNASRGRELNRQALRRFRALALPREVARTAFNLGLVAEREGDLAEAAALWDEALQALLPNAEHATALQVGAKRVALHVQQEQLAEAAALVERLRAAYTAIEAPLPRAALDTAAAELERVGGDIAAARTLHARALQLRRDSGREDWAWASELELLRLDMMTEAPSGELRARAEVLGQRFSDGGEPRDVLLARLLEAQSLLRGGRDLQAAALLQDADALLGGFTDAGLGFELRRLQLLAGDRDGRSERLLALGREAAGRGFALAASRCRLAAAQSAPGEGAEQSALVARGLSGLLLE